MLGTVCWERSFQNCPSAAVKRLSIRRTTAPPGTAQPGSAARLHEIAACGVLSETGSSHLLAPGEPEAHPSPSFQPPLTVRVPRGRLRDLRGAYCLDRGRPSPELHGFHTPPREPVR